MNHKRLQTIAAVFIGICVGVSVFLHLLPSESVAEKLARTSKELNARLPRNLDADTRWDTTIAGPGNCLTYCYTLVNASLSEINPDDVIARAKPKILLNYRTNPDMKAFREDHVTLRFQIKDKAGQTVTVIEVSPKDL
jgi:hypothetical protein